MAIEIKVPQLPESVSDATLVSWNRSPGDAVHRDEDLVELETDKVVLAVPCPRDGILSEIRAANGATVTSGEVLALLEPLKPGDSPQPSSARVQATAEDGPAGAADEGPPEAVDEESSMEAVQPVVNVEPEPAPVAGEHAEKTGPAVRRLMREHQVDAADIRGTGPGGRITKSDVLDYVGRETRDLTHADQDSPVFPAPTENRGEQRVPMTRLRARIAERLVEAQHTAAMLTTFNEVDMSAIISARKRYGEAFSRKYEVKLGFMSFFIKASVEALRRFPVLNASVDGTDILYHEFFDIGVAVSTDRGLIVPILRGAEAMGFGEIERTIVDFGTRARSGQLGMDDLTGGTFTITNGGIFGSMMSTPIINPPQSGILGMHSIQQRPVVINGEVVVRPMMYLALTYDHRIVDGREAVQFLVAIKDVLEDPARLLLQV